MNVSISKKILMTAIYFLIGHIINTFIETLLGYNGNGYTPLSIIVLSVVLCASSRHIRVGKLKSIHKGDDSQEKVVFNSNLKTKIQFVVKSKDFKVEVVIFVIVSAILILIPLLQTSFAYGFDAILASNPNLIYLIIGLMMLMPLCMASLDVIAWISAYNRCYKRRDF